MTTKRPGAGSRLEHEDLDRQFFPAPVPDESAVLQRIRGHADLRVMTTAARRGRCFTNVFASLIVTLRTQLVDVLFSFLRGTTDREAHARHNSIIEAVSIMLDVCGHSKELSAWSYTDEQIELIKGRFTLLTGWGRCLRRTRLRADTLSLSWMADLKGSSRVSRRTGHTAQKEDKRNLKVGQDVEGGPVSDRDIVETPFLLAFLFALQSEAFPLLPLASTLARASKGFWNIDYTVFTVAQEQQHGVTMDAGWMLETEHMQSFGVVSVYFEGPMISRFQFQNPWPLVRVHNGKGFLPEACRVPVMPKRRFAPDRKLLELDGKDSPYLSLAIREWEAVMGTLAAELRIVLEGRFAISRSELPLAQVVYKNHPSWENNPEARKALWPVLAQYLVLGQFEYVRKGDPLPIAILPIGAVPKSTFPFWRLILDCRYSNRFIDPWPIRYLSMAGLSLLLSKTASSQWRTSRQHTF